MRNRLFLFAALAAASLPFPAGATITYAPGTTIEDAWMSSPRIPAPEAVAILVDRWLARHDPSSEPEITPEEFEALKYLRGHPDQIHEEPSSVEGERVYVSELAPGSMTADQESFLEDLSHTLTARLGVTTMAAATGVCVIERKLLEATRYRWKFSGFNEIDIMGLTVFARNYQYGANNSDLVYGIFPFGVEASWLGAIGCLIDRPKSEEELRACGKERSWKVEDGSQLSLRTAHEHTVPGVGPATVTYAGAVASGESEQFQTRYQTRPAADPTWLLGPSNTPLPSRTESAVTGYPGWLYSYDFSQVMTWEPSIILQAAYAEPTAGSLWNFNPTESVSFVGHSSGNPHSIGDWTVRGSFRRNHGLILSCN